MTAATVMQIVAWGVRLVGVVLDLVRAAIEAAQDGAAPTLDELDARLAEHQANDARDRAAAYAQNLADAEARVREAAAREYSAELDTELKKP